MTNYLAEKRVAYLSLGCKVNSYETEAIKNQLEGTGTITVSFRETADIYLVNTCTVTNVADRKSRQMLHQARKRNPQAIVVAMGCYVQEFHENHEEDDGISILIGNRRKGETVRILNDYLKMLAEGEVPERQFVYDDQDLKEYEELEMVTQEKNCRAYIKIQDGCNQFCSYCIIPFARGRISSRKPENVIREVKALAQKGFCEIVLTGIHLSSYGLEQYTVSEQAALQVKEGELPLLSLLRSLQEIEGIKRIRLGSLEPRVVTMEFAKAIAELTKICPHFHLSLQSGCNRTLKNMNRKYTAEEYAAACSRLRQVYKDPAITTDIIVGFPQETDADFEESKSFAERMAFSQIHVFPFSRRKGTAADRMSGQVPESVKKTREQQMLAAADTLHQAYAKQVLGKQVQVLVEEMTEFAGKTYCTGCTDTYVKCLFAGTREQINRICTITAVEVLPDGRVLGEQK